MEIAILPVGPLQANCYILSDSEKNAVVVDPGGDAPRILEEIRKRSLRVQYIFLTHVHFDHFLAAAEVREAAGAPLLVPKEDADALAALLTERSGHAVAVRVPQRGQRRALLDIAHRNAREEVERVTDAAQRISGTLRQLQQLAQRPGIRWRLKIKHHLRIDAATLQQAQRFAALGAAWVMVNFYRVGHGVSLHFLIGTEASLQIA